MSQSGANPTDRSKPKFLKLGGRFTPENCYATARGWVYKHRNGKEELLIAISNLSTKITGAQITEVFFDNSIYSPTGTAGIVVVFTEKVTVTSGAATISVTTGLGSPGPFTFTYVSGSGTDKLLFTRALTGTGVTPGDTLEIAAQTIGSTVWADTAGGSDTVGTAFVGANRYAPLGKAPTYAGAIFGGATITKASFSTTAFAPVSTLGVKVQYNQPVTVTGAPTVVVGATTTGAQTLTYVSGSGTNTLLFTKAFTGTAAETLSLAGQTIALAGGTINDSIGTACAVAFAGGVLAGGNLTGTYANIVVA